MAILRECDVHFYPDHKEIFIESSKTDQYRDGSVDVTARTGTECYPVAMMERYMRLAGISVIVPSNKFLFRGLI